MVGLGDSKDDASAEQSARAWLALVDSGEYEASWEQASELFKSKITAAQWSGAVAGVRQSLGGVISRDLESAMPAKKLLGAPDGHYLVLKFSTHFENRLVSVETVTPKLDDGVWRVSGYFVQ